MARTYDLQDTLNVLNTLASPDTTAALTVVNDLVPAYGDSVTMTDSVSLPNSSHSGVYLYNNATSMWGLAQWG